MLSTKSLIAFMESLHVPLKVHPVFIGSNKHLFSSDVPALPPLPTPKAGLEDLNLEDEEITTPKPDSVKRKHASGPKVQDPYAMADSTSYMIPIGIAIGAFIPLLYCLCKI